MGSGPAPRWAVPAVATALVPHVAPMVTGLLRVALFVGADCGEGCEPALRGPLHVVSLGHSLSLTLTPAALVLCWLLVVRRSWSTARWIAAGLAFVPPAMIAMGVMLLFVPGPGPDHPPPSCGGHRRRTERPGPDAARAGHPVKGVPPVRGGHAGAPRASRRARPAQFSVVSVLPGLPVPSGCSVSSSSASTIRYAYPCSARNRCRWAAKSWSMVSRATTE